MIALALLAADHVALSSRTVRVADVVAGSSSTTVVATLPRRTVTLSRAALARLVARATGETVTPGVGDVTLTYTPATKVRSPYAAPEAAVTKGAAIEVATSIGPVRIARQVTAMESARPGAALFVRDADGQVFAAIAPGGAR